jgi:hypothetical protein
MMKCMVFLLCIFVATVYSMNRVSVKDKKVTFHYGDGTTYVTFTSVNKVSVFVNRTTYSHELHVEGSRNSESSSWEWHGYIKDRISSSTFQGTPSIGLVALLNDSVTKALRASE